MADPMAEERLKVKEVPIGFVLTKPATSRAYKTGGWRRLRPVIDKMKCNDCGLCWIYCPDSCVSITERGYEIDLDFCKGCGICSTECPMEAITMVEEG